MPDLFNVCKNHTTSKLQWTRKQSAVYDPDTPVTLKQGQGHQSWSELVDSKHGYNNAQYENPCFNSVCEKANDTVFVKSGNMSTVSLEYM